MVRSSINPASLKFKNWMCELALYVRIARYYWDVATMPA